MNEKTYFNPDQYSRDADYPSDNEKPLDAMTMDDAVMIVCGQARESDFYNEVVEQAIQILEKYYENLTRTHADGNRLYIVPNDTEDTWAAVDFDGNRTPEHDAPLESK